MPDSIPDGGAKPKLGRASVDNNRRPWNGAGYTEFTEAQKKMVRAHQAGLVKQTDHEVGEILSSLRNKCVRENTLIVFATDHADHPGGHDMSGKVSFYGTCMRIPLIVSPPGVPGRPSTAASLSSGT